MSAHTKGPWVIGRSWDSKYAQSIHQPGGLGIINCNGIARPKTDGEANARLIAAAPDLLEALIALHAVAKVDRNEDYAAITNAAAAIHRAVGRVS